MAGLLGSIVELVLYGTGEVLMWAFTMGGRTPRWPYTGKESATLEELLVQRSTWLGLLFWAAVLAVIGFFGLSGRSS